MKISLRIFLMMGVFFIISMEARMSGPIKVQNEDILFYKNISPFHQEGEALWLRADGQLIFRDLTREVKVIVEKIYQVKLSDEQMKKYDNLIKKKSYKNITIKDRQGVPEEVRAHLSFISNDKSLKFEFWEGDLMKQDERLKELVDDVKSLSKIAMKTRPISSKAFPIRTSIPDFWPSEMKR